MIGCNGIACCCGLLKPSIGFVFVLRLAPDSEEVKLSQFALGQFIARSPLFVPVDGLLPVLTLTAQALVQIITHIELGYGKAHLCGLHVIFKGFGLIH